MKHLRWFVLPVLFMAAEAALSAQIVGGNPIVDGPRRLSHMIIEASWWLGLGAIAFAGVATMLGRFDADWMLRLAIGGALAFGASSVAGAMFPGMAP